VISGSYFHDLSQLFETKNSGAYYWDNLKHSFKPVSDEVKSVSELLVGQKELAYIFAAVSQRGAIRSYFLVTSDFECGIALRLYCSQEIAH